MVAFAPYCFEVVGYRGFGFAYFALFALFVKYPWYHFMQTVHIFITMDIKDFLRSQNNGEPVEQNSGQQNQSNQSQPNKPPTQMNDKIKHYSSMSEQQLMQEMFRQASNEKASGGLTSENLESFYKQASPMMTQAQRNKLRGLINSLKQ